MSPEADAAAETEAGTVSAENGEPAANTLNVNPETVTTDAGTSQVVTGKEEVTSGAESAPTANTNADAASSAVTESQDPAFRALELLKSLQSAQPESSDANAAVQKQVSDNAAVSDNTAQASTITEDFGKAVEVFRQITGDADYKPADLQTFLKDISAFQAKAFAEGNTNGLKELVSSKPVRNLVFDVLKDQWRISPSEVADKDKVEALYKRLGDQINILKEGLSSVNAQNTPAFQAAENMSSNLDFLNQINQMYAYIQLPLKLSGGDNAHGDLYVYSNRKNMTSDDSTVTAFMHLDMDHLGPVDVYVAMDLKSGGKVQTNFTVADDEILTFLEENMHILNERLNKRGYDLSCKMSLKGEEETPEEDALTGGGVNLLLLHAGGMGGSFPAGMRSFDVRA